MGLVNVVLVTTPQKTTKQVDYLLAIDVTHLSVHRTRVLMLYAPIQLYQSQLDRVALTSLWMPITILVMKCPVVTLMSYVHHLTVNP